MNRTLSKGVAHYLSLPYKYEIERDDEGEFVGHIALLPGCVADGRTPAEAATNLQAALRAWVEARLESELPVPEPQTEFSGKWLVRTSPSLHRKVTEYAARENVSMNQFVNNVLAGVVGAREGIAGLYNQPCRLQLMTKPYGSYVVIQHLAMSAMFWSAPTQGIGANLDATIEQSEVPALLPAMRA